MSISRNIWLPTLIVSLWVFNLDAASEEKRGFFRFGKKDKEAEKAETAAAKHQIPTSLAGIGFSMPPAGAIRNDPLRSLWDSAEFQRRFLGRYGFHPDIEPELTDTNEISFMREIAPLLDSEEDRKLAAYVLKTNLTAKSHPQLDFTLGSLYFQGGDFPSAAASFRNAIDKFPDFRRAHKNLGFTLLKMGRYPEAAAPLSAAIELGDRDATTYGLLGFCYLTQKLFIPAEAALKQAMLFEPDNEKWRANIVQVLVAQQKFDDANQMVEEVLQRDPANVAMWHQQAKIYSQLEQPKLAAVNYEIIRKLGGATPEMLFRLGDIYMGEESTGLALPVYQEAIREAGMKDIARSLRTAKLLVSRGALSEAKKLFTSVREAAGDGLDKEHELELLKSEAKVATAEGEPERAAAILQSVVERDPLDGEALLLIGDHFLSVNEIEKAEFRYDLAAKIEGFEADALVKLAQLRVKQQKYDDAIALLNKAQKLKPRDTVQNYLEAIERIRRNAA